MDEETQRQAEEELECILELMEEWALKYGKDYVTASAFVGQDEIVSFGDVDEYPNLSVFRETKRTPHARQGVRCTEKLSTLL